ncbi:hypothetical protein [Arenibacter aquaticus]|uniref:hypothetical protein n=1 Tax=Arenibacter aquaticus TaxID=2489054 RepID=UPI001304BB31|nr:hypothetical protein [Arenibacter aquaticus]
MKSLLFPVGFMQYTNKIVAIMITGVIADDIQAPLPETTDTENRDRIREACGLA